MLLREHQRTLVAGAQEFRFAAPAAFQTGPTAWMTCRAGRR